MALPSCFNKEQKKNRSEYSEVTTTSEYFYCQ